MDEKNYLFPRKDGSGVVDDLSHEFITMNRSGSSNQNNLLIPDRMVAVL